MDANEIKTIAEFIQENRLVNEVVMRCRTKYKVRGIGVGSLQTYYSAVKRESIEDCGLVERLLLECAQEIMSESQQLQVA